MPSQCLGTALPECKPCTLIFHVAVGLTLQVKPIQDDTSWQAARANAACTTRAPIGTLHRLLTLPGAAKAGQSYHLISSRPLMTMPKTVKSIEHIEQCAAGYVNKSYFFLVVLNISTQLLRKTQRRSEGVRPSQDSANGSWIGLLCREGMMIQLLGGIKCRKCLCKKCAKHTWACRMRRK